MKIAVTGANGFVGAALCRYFYRAGHTVIALGRQPEPPAQLRQFAQYISADITRKVPILEADVCVHAAALASDTASYPDLYASNVAGTVQVLQAAVNCPYFIQISSSSVYAFKNHAMREHEASLESKLSTYGTTKLLAERQLETQIPAGQKRLILRPRGIYGLGDRVLLPRLLKLVKKDKMYLPVPPTIQTSLTHVDNIGYAIMLFLQKQDQPALQIFNLADDSFYNLRESLIQLISEVYPKQLQRVTVPVVLLKILATLNKIIPISPRLNPLVLNVFTQSSVLDLTQIKKHLLYAPSFTFNQTVPKIGQWVKSIGGVEAYLQKQEMTPWLMPDINI